MVDFKNMRGGDPEGQAKNNQKKPEKEKTTPSSVVDTSIEPLPRLHWIKSPHLKEIYELSENILDSAGAIKDKIAIYETAQSHAKWKEIIKDAE